MKAFYSDLLEAYFLLNWKVIENIYQKVLDKCLFELFYITLPYLEPEKGVLTWPFNIQHILVTRCQIYYYKVRLPKLKGQHSMEFLFESSTFHHSRFQIRLNHPALLHRFCLKRHQHSKFRNFLLLNLCAKHQLNEEFEDPLIFVTCIPKLLVI